MRVLDSFITGRRENLDGIDVDLIEGSILDESTLAEAVDGCTAVFHQAAIPRVPRSVEFPVESHENNATGTALEKAGKAIQTQMQQQATAYQKNIAQQEQELIAAQQELQRQQTILSQDAFEAKRKEFNEWVRTNKNYDGVVDFDAATRDPSAPTKLLPQYNSGDNLHLNDAGYQVMANAVDLALFKKKY